MRKYELMLILNPNVAEDERNSSLQNLKKTLEEYGAKVEKEDIWGNRKMAYKINSSKIGFYVLLNLEMDGKFVAPLTKFMNLDLNIWRYMLVRQDV